MHYKKNNLLVSIIVPNYNHEKYLIQRLESIFNQTFQDFEVILLDDCSTDNSREILSKYAENPKVSHCIFNETNSGNTFVQWNRGIALAKGEYIWIAESDDFCETIFLEELVNYFNKNQDLTLVYCQSTRANENGTVTGSWLDYTDRFDEKLFLADFIMDGNKFIENFLIHRNIIPNASGVLFLKDKAMQLLPLDMDIDMRYCGDWLFYIKLLINFKVGFVSKSLNNFRYHSNSVIAKSAKFNDSVYRIDVLIKMRLKIEDFLINESIGDFDKTKKINKKTIRLLQYDKALSLIRNREKRGILYLLPVLDLFITKYRFRKNFEMQRKKFVDKILRKKENSNTK
ncbi:MAG: glycosyltransferase family 2 protein [Lutibacter sp.]